MLNTEFLTAYLLHQNRVREAEKRRTTLELMRTDDPMANATQADLLRDIRQWMQARDQKVEVSDARRAHAI